ncbi:FecR domain-containing protein [Chitinophaga oryzae]|uniref:FecR domain-containing protein n=1 Tax=Chitinophaga oryzae TaxID=2725414 RepID=A0AAE7D768_9BACT|nr:FecR domain-containing protein [Chitinophaga oryzae]QJB32057.1 FecR domain-containing protein [Chitinophaga oryzae]
MENAFNSAEDFLQDDSFLRYCMGISEEDTRRWEDWLRENPDRQASFEQARKIFDVINGQQGQLHAAVGNFRLLLREHVANTTAQAPAALTPPARGQQRRLYWWSAAAAAVLLVSITGWYHNSRYRGQQQIAAAPPAHDAQPGTSKAVLTLADGTTVPLDSAGASQFEEKDGTRINKSQGSLVYGHSGNTEEKILFNTLATPRGGEYQITLPDGSRVWLNAASSLRFPTRFAGNERTVYLNGEAYFEITPNARQPFHVQLSDNQQITVLGTSFNVMNYADENNSTTTLVTGKVMVSRPGGQQAVLAPSQQAVITRGQDRIAVSEADVDKTIAWKTGMFEFEDDDLPSIMRQLARWYDVTVVYEGAIPDQHYSGSIRKTAALSQALRILQTAGIQYSITNKTIIIKNI